MAIACTGVTATWAALGPAVDFTELVRVSVEVAGQPPQGRADNWTIELGTVTIECLGKANIGLADYGKRGTLTFAGGGLDLSIKAIYIGHSMAGQVNDVARYRATFRLTDG